MFHGIAQPEKIYRILFLYAVVFCIMVSFSNALGQSSGSNSQSHFHPRNAEKPEHKHMSPHMRYRILPYDKPSEHFPGNRYSLGKTGRHEETAWSWQNPHPQGNSLLSIFFTDADNGWTVGAHGIIFATSDKGRSWSVQESGTTHWLAGVHFANEYEGWVVGEAGTVLHSVNGGASWHTQNSPTDRHLANVFFIDTKKGWAVGDAGTIAATSDGGDTWLIREAGTAKWLSSVFFYNQNTGWAVGEEGTILHTANAGFTWARQSSPISQSLSSVYFTTADSGWIVGEAGTLLQTIDGGGTWTDKSLKIGHRLNRINFLNKNIGWITGWYGLLYQTTDSGKSWSKVESGTRNDIEDIVFTDIIHGYAAGSWGLIINTKDGGISWNELNSRWSKESLSGVFFADSVTGWAVGDHGTILHTSNGGNFWQIQSSDTSYSLRDVFFINSSIGWAVGSYGKILKTSGGGTTWIEQSTDNNTFYSGVHFINDRVGWIVGAAGAILHTLDGGASWEKQENPSNDWLSAVYFLNAHTGWAVGGDGIILHTTDGGTIWEENKRTIPPDTTLPDSLAKDPTSVRWSYHWLLNIQFVDPENGWITGGTGTILHTSDGGETWENQQNEGANWTEDWLYGLSMISSQVGWTAGWNGTILRTENGGETWLPCQSGTSNGIFGIITPTPSQGWAVGEGGTILTFHDPEAGLSDRKQYNRYRVARINTGSYATIIVQDTIEIIHVSDASFKFMPKDEIGIFTPGGVVAGARAWSENNFIMTVWGDDAQTLLVDGFQEDETFKMRVWIDREGLEYKISPTFASGPPNFTPNAFSLIDAMELRGEEPEVIVTQPIRTNNDVVGVAFQDNYSVSLKFTAGEVAGRTATFISYGDTIANYPAVLPHPEKALQYFHISIDTLTTMSAAITVGFSETDTLGRVGGISAENLTLAYFDSLSMRWLSVPTIINTETNRAAAQFAEASLWLLGDKTDNLITGLREGVTADIPTSFFLSDNFPNPFNPVTHIRYLLPQYAFVTLKIYNLLGQEVITLVRENQTPGEYEMQWDARNQSGIPVTSGIYFYRLSAGDFIQTKKMMVLR